MTNHRTSHLAQYLLTSPPTLDKLGNCGTTFHSFLAHYIFLRAATAGKAGKIWSLPRFWVSILSYKKQPVKKIWGRILDLSWLKFAVAALIREMKKGPTTPNFT